MLTADPDCRHDVAHDGRYVMVRKEPALRDGPPRPPELGWVPDHPSGVSLDLYDSETGERLWSREAEDGWQDGFAITGDDPLTVDADLGEGAGLRQPRRVGRHRRGTRQALQRRRRPGGRQLLRGEA